MTCPNCSRKALRFIQFLYYNPFQECRCRSCGAILRTGTLIRVLCLVTLGVALASFLYTFPAMSNFIDSRSDETTWTLLGTFLPYVIIPVQVVLFFIPTVAYTWRWGRLLVVVAPRRGPVEPRRPGRVESEARQVVWCRPRRR